MKKFFNIKSVVNILVGATFIVSAILKLVSVTNFELYIFSFGFFSFDFSSFVARLVIGGEMALGVGYIFNKYHKLFNWAVLGIIGGFTLFLIYLVVIGRGDNCHCFGEALSLDPKWSIVKNLVIIAAALYTRKVDYNIPVKGWMVIAFCVVVAALPIAVNPPDVLFTKVLKSEKEVETDLIAQFVESNTELGIGKNKRVVEIYSTGCEYCRMAQRKISHMIDVHNLDRDGVLTLFFGDESKVPDFFDLTESPENDYRVISPTVLIPMVNGSVPTVLVYRPDGTYDVYGYREIDEKAIVEALSKVE